MAVVKYRSAEDAAPFTAARLDPDNLRRVPEWSAFCRRLHPWLLTPGVFRYRTIDEAASARAEQGTA
jgi:hypothetical protein